MNLNCCSCRTFIMRKRRGNHNNSTAKGQLAISLNRLFVFFSFSCLFLSRLLIQSRWPSSTYTSTSPLPTQLSPLILACIPPTFLPLSDFLSCSLPHLSSRSGFSNGTQEVFEPEELNAHFLSLFSVDLICILGFNLYSCSSIRIPGYSARVRIVLTPSLALFHQTIARKRRCSYFL